MWGLDYVIGWGYGDVIVLVDGVIGSDFFGYWCEVVLLMWFVNSLVDVN